MLRRVEDAARDRGLLGDLAIRMRARARVHEGRGAAARGDRAALAAGRRTTARRPRAASPSCCGPTPSSRSTISRSEIMGPDVWLGRADDFLSQYLWSRAGSVYGGTEQIQKNLVAQRLLGMPRVSMSMSERARRSRGRCGSRWPTRIMTVTLHRPDRLNALDHELLEALAKTWNDARALRGARRRHHGCRAAGFCSGFDVRRDGEVPAAGDSSGLRARINPHVLGLAALAKPVLAAVNGVAAGAGLALALRRRRPDRVHRGPVRPGATRGIGVIPDGGGTYFIPRLVGWSRAFEWIATSEEVSAEQARARWGLVNEVVEPGDLMDRTLAKARQLCRDAGRRVGPHQAAAAPVVGVDARRAARTRGRGRCRWRCSRPVGPRPEPQWWRRWRRRTTIRGRREGLRQRWTTRSTPSSSSRRAGLLTVTLNRPDSLNSVDAVMHEEFEHLFRT